jgi:PEP-CTERM motif
MKKTLLILVCLAAVASMASANTNYSFSTTGSYTGVGTVGGFCTAGDYCVNFAAGTDGGTGDALVIQLQYTPNSNSAVATAGDSFGHFQLFCLDDVNGGADSNCSNVTLAGDFTITVSQTVPFVINTGQFVDTLSGTVGDSTGAGFVDFGTTSFTYANGSSSLTYTLQQPVGGYLINQISDNSNTSVQGLITDNGVPEPATFGMMGAALVGLGFLARKRKS